MRSAHPTHRYLLWLGLLAVAVVIAYFLAWHLPLYFASATPPQTTGASIPASFPKNIPPPAASDYIAAQTGFQYLVSYTGEGFIPQTLSVKKGETVRFTNNSNSALNLKLKGTQSQTLAHAAYFEYTYATTGSFTYSDGSNVGTVTVN